MYAIISVAVKLDLNLVSSVVSILNAVDGGTELALIFSKFAVIRIF